MTSELRFSRHAIDSTDEAMDMTFSLRIPHPWAKFLRAARPKTFIRLEREAAARAAEAERASSAA